jgi:hypothetical protein
MGILDETATEDDYVAPEYDVLADLGNWAIDPQWTAPEILQSDYLSGVASNVGDFVGGISDFSQDNMYNIPSMISAGANWLGEQSADVFSRMFAGEEISPLETIEALGIGAAGASKGVKALRSQAPGFGITREALPGQEKAAGWYNGAKGKVKEVSKMGTSAFTNPLKRLWSPEADVLWNKYGISDLQQKELKQVIENMETIPPGKGDYPKKFQHRNHIISQLQSNKTLRDKFNLDSPEFYNDMEKLLFPKTVNTKGADLMDSSVPLQQVMPELSDLPPQAILDHMSIPMAKQLGVGKSKDLQIQTKVWNGRPLADFSRKNNAIDPDMGGKTYKAHRPGGKQPSSSISAYPLWKNAPEGSKFDAAGFEKLLKKHNDSVKETGKGYFVNPFDLVEDMVDSGDYISFGGRYLGTDKLLATYNNRLIINKNTGDAFLFTFDDMHFGAGSRKLDKLIEAGSRDITYVDLQILSKKSNTVSGTDTVAKQQRNMKYAEVADELTERLKVPLYGGATTGDKARFMAKRAAQGATGYGILNYDEDE